MSSGVYAKRAGEGPGVVLLHGLFGSGANQGALSRSLRNAFTVFSLDLPAHGRSDRLVNLDLCRMADSLNRWMEEEGLSHAHVVGHSLGGKVAMQLALQFPEKVESLVVADIAPVQYAAHHDEVFAALAAVADGQCGSREEAVQLMARHIEEDAVIQFLLASLQRDSRGNFAWRFDLEGIKAAYPALRAAPESGRSYAGPVLFIRGGDSDYVQEQHKSAITSFFPTATVKVMPDCGHWLHAEKPQLFNGLVGRFLAVPKQRMLVRE
jgi:esterase